MTNKLFALMILLTLTGCARGMVAPEKASAETPAPPASEEVLLNGVPYTLGDGKSHRTPLRAVDIKAFYIDRTEVTQAQFQHVMGTNPSLFKGCGGDCPVESVTWHEAVRYCKSIGKRLPTETEWEYAAKGKKGVWAGTNSESGLHEYAWYSENSGGTPHEVATRLPNDRGLYDMSGNVWEWTADRFPVYSGSNVYKNHREIRGGSWDHSAENALTATRGRSEEDVRSDNSGFRCARTPGLQSLLSGTKPPPIEKNKKVKQFSWRNIMQYTWGDWHLPVISRYLESCFDDTQNFIIPAKKVKAWMRSSNLDVLGAVNQLINDTQCLNRINPPLALTARDYHDFSIKYIEKCIIENPDSALTISRHAAAYEIMSLFLYWWTDDSVPRELPHETKELLEKLYMEGDEAIRTAITHETLKHLFRWADIREFFSDWAADSALAEAYEEAAAFGRYNTLSIIFLADRNVYLVLSKNSMKIEVLNKHRQLMHLYYLGERFTGMELTEDRRFVKLKRQIPIPFTIQLDIILKNSTAGI